jgi:hypothetical protein
MEIGGVKTVMNLSKDLFGEIGSLKETNSFGSTDPAIAVQIRSPKVRFELIHIRPLILPRHFLFNDFPSTSFRFKFPQITNSQFYWEMRNFEEMPKSKIVVVDEWVYGRAGIRFVGSKDWLNWMVRSRWDRGKVWILYEFGDFGALKRKREVREGRAFEPSLSCKKCIGYPLFWLLSVSIGRNGGYNGKYRYTVWHLFMIFIINRVLFSG